MTVDVGTGRAWFNRTWTYSDAKIPLILDTSDLLYDRIDAVVLEIDTRISIRDNSIKIVKGTPAQKPEKPALTNDEDIHQYALAYVQVRASAIEIGAGDITINVGQEDCPFATSIVETPELDVLFAQWDAQFTEWFENVQSQLEGDIAANLQRQIDELRKNTEDEIDSLASDDTLTIGDILYTARKNLGSRFHLCNGASLSRTSYPDLSRLYPTTINGSWTTKLSKVYDSNDCSTNILYVNEQLLIIRTYYVSSSSKYIGEILYGSSPSSEFTKVTVVEDTAGLQFKKIVYVGGWYVICGSIGPNAVIWYANSPSGSWADIKLTTYSTDATCVAHDIAYNGSYFVIAGEFYTYASYGRACVWYATAISSSSWTKRELWQSGTQYGSYAMANTICYGNGKFLVGGYYAAALGHPTAILAYATSPGSWTTKELSTDVSSTHQNRAFNPSINIARFLNSKFVIGGQYKNYAYIAQFDDPATMRSFNSLRKNMWSVSSSALSGVVDTFQGILGIDYDAIEKKYVFSGRRITTNGYDAVVGRVAVNGTSNLELYVLLSSSNKDDIMYSGAFGISVISRMYSVACINGASDSRTISMEYINLDNFNIPSISVDRAYAYIKTKDA